MHHLDVYTYKNRLRQVSPQQKLLFAIAILLIALLTHPLSQLLIALWLSVWIVGYARIPIQVYLRVLLLSAAFLLASIPALVVEFIPIEQIAAVQADRITGFALGSWFLFVSRSGLMQAVEIASRSIACTSCLLFVLFTIPFTDLLQVLRQWRVPVLLIELLLLMYRFVFLFLDVVTELQRAQQARGGYRTRRRSLHSVGLLVSQLLVRSLQHYHQFSLAIAARGFNGTFQVHSIQPFTCSNRYAIEALIGCVSLVLLDFNLSRWPAV